jgi:hypothetical protein
MKQEIEIEMNEVPIIDIGLYSFTALSTRYENRARSHLIAAAYGLHPDLHSRLDLTGFAASIGTAIQEYVKGIESERKREHFAYLEAESDRRAQELEAQFQTDLANMSLEEAEKRRLQREEYDRQMQEQADEHARRRSVNEQIVSDLRAEAEGYQRESAAIRAAQEKSERDARRLLDQMAADRKASEERWAKELAEERVKQEQRNQELSSLLQQLASRPIIYVYQDDSSVDCNVY